MKFPNYPDLRPETLLDLYNSIRKALEEDDKLQAGHKKYEARDFTDWKAQAIALERVLDSQSIKYSKIVW